MVESDRDSMSHCSSHGNRVPMGTKRIKELKKIKGSLKGTPRKLLMISLSGLRARQEHGIRVLQNKYRWALSLQKDFI